MPPSGARGPVPTDAENLLDETFQVAVSSDYRFRPNEMMMLGPGTPKPIIGKPSCDPTMCLERQDFFFAFLLFAQ